MAKDIRSVFDIFKTNSIDMSKLESLIFQKSKDCFILKQMKGSPNAMSWALSTEQDVKKHWINKTVEDLKIDLPFLFFKLEEFKDGHLLECFK